MAVYRPTGPWRAVLSRSHPRFHRRQEDVDRYQRRRRPAQRADHSERPLQRDPVLGRKSKTLEEQAALPIVNPIEMGQSSMDAAVAGIGSIEEYRQSFQQVFGRAPNGPDLVRAIASYERTQVAFDAPFDHFIAGDNNAIDDSAKRGWELFNTKARCNKYHARSEENRDVTTFTDNDSHNIGIGIVRHNVVALARQAEQLIDSGHAEAVDQAAVATDFSALGRFQITKKEADIAAFKTPDIRNIW
jgi:cytochrome c peroxidase